MRNKVVLVNEADEQLGVMEKQLAHKEAVLHRAFSVFLFSKDINGNWQVLMQKRADDKYHCGGLWTNTCCSHPQPGESVLAAGVSRLKEELGIEQSDLEEDSLKNIGCFIYKAKFPNGLTEHELDHVLVGFVDRNIKLLLNYAEVSECKWYKLDIINDLIESKLTDLTPDLTQDLTQDLTSGLTPWLAPAIRLALTALPG